MNLIILYFFYLSNEYDNLMLDFQMKICFFSEVDSFPRSFSRLAFYSEHEPNLDNKEVQNYINFFLLSIF